MKITSAELKIIATRRSQYPTNLLSEFLLVGRSNVGKSSFINTILNRKNLARTSSHPGKTQTLNFYLVNDDFYLIDVPGYGYAEVNKKTKAKFGLMIEEYLETRQELKRVFMLVDFRHKPTEDDVLMYNFLKYYNLKVTIVATKADKIGTSKREKCKKQITDTLDLVVGDDIVIFSSVTKEGREEILKKIEDLVVDTI
ncbi:MAG TPA: YihA family ribosome biogenesis GTP-binding protein [Candidatus Onthousia faecavium]|nr:YihA family ribosome biogenesis GTP-binding protein [Candidatus Onthousia faecavium]